MLSIKKPFYNRQLIVKGWEKMYLVNSNQKKATVAILIPGKVDFRVRKFNRDKEGHFILIK